MGFAAERALLYILASEEAGEPPPHALTQEGIAHAIRSGRSSVAKSLLRLGELGFVSGRRDHVPGHRLRKHVYRLTTAGWEEAVRIRTYFGSRVVRVRGAAEAEIQVRLAEIPDLFPSAGDLASVVARIRHGTIEATELAAPQEGPLLPPPWGMDLPRPQRLVGRDRESSELEAWLRSEPRPLVVTGLAGIGKTALVASAVARWRERYAVFWVCVRPWSSRATLSAEVAKFLAVSGRRGLERALLDRADPQDDVFVGLLRDAVRGRRDLFVFDDVHAARPSVRRWLFVLASALGSGPGRLILVGRSAPKIAAPDVPRGVEVRVGPLPGPAAREILRLHGWNTDDPLSGTILREARGNPLLLLLGARAGVAGPREIEQFLEDEVWSVLSRAERRALEAASCFRRPVPDRALLAVPGVDADALHRLERRGLLGRSARGAFMLHPTVESFVRRRTSLARRQACHAAAARYFRTVSEPMYRLEAVHHALEAGAPEAAAEFLRREGESLFNSVSFAALRDVVADVDASRLPPDSGAILFETQADAFRREGAVRPAAARYEQALHCAEESGHAGDQGRVLRKLAELDRVAGRYVRARDRLIRAAEAVASAAGALEASNVYRELALVEMARGDLEAAGRHLSRALRAARASRDPGRFSRALLVFGTLEATRGNRELGLQRKLLALTHAEASGELAEIARDAISIGVSLAEMKRFEEALPRYDQGLRMARLLGDVRLIAIAELDRAAALCDLGRWPEARPALDEADRMAQLVGMKKTRGSVAIGRGQIDMALGRWRQAADNFELGLQVLRDHGSPYELARVLLDVGSYYAQRGEAAMAEERWQEGLGLAQTMKNEGLTCEIGERLTLAHSTTAVESSPPGGA